MSHPRSELVRRFFNSDAQSHSVIASRGLRFLSFCLTGGLPAVCTDIYYFQCLGKLGRQFTDLVCSRYDISRGFDILNEFA